MTANISSTTLNQSQYLGRSKGYGRTNFYPQYNSLNDRVEAIQPIMPGFFQSIIPRYNLSTSETRDMGLGPVFDADLDQIILSSVSKAKMNKGIQQNPLEEPSVSRFQHRMSQESGKGYFVDFLV